LTIGGQPVGWEKFQIVPNGAQVEARAQIALQVLRNGKALHFKTYPDLLLNSHLEPRTYSWSQRGPERSELQMDLRRSPSTVRYHTVKGIHDDRTFQLPRDVLILDDNVIHQYEIVIWRFYMTSGNRQQFNAFIPQEALPGLITLQDLGQDAAGAPSKDRPLRHLLLITDQARIDLYVDESHRIQRVAIPAGQFQAIRQK
jgi:hypothetical protein